MTQPAKLSEDTVKHLEFIQGIVGRLANNSFLIKGWTLTVLAALVAFQADDLNPWLAVGAFIPAIGFWALDATFLRTERLFRHLYNAVRKQDQKVEPMSMDIKPFNDKEKWIAVLFSSTLLLFYGSLLLANVLLVAIAAVVG